MRNTCLLLVALLVCVAAVPAQTPELIWHSGNAFLSTCALAGKTSNELTSAQMGAMSDCLPYVRGLDDGIGLLNTPYCEPDGLTNGQVLRIFVKYINDNPESAHLQTSKLYLLAMEKAFPCSTKK